jgi:hypothetical protein
MVIAIGMTLFVVGWFVHDDLKDLRRTQSAEKAPFLAPFLAHLGLGIIGLMPYVFVFAMLRVFVLE